MARNVVFGLLVVGMMVGVPSVAGENSESDPPIEELLETIGTVLDFADAACFDLEYGSFDAGDLVLNIKPGLVRPSYLIEIPIAWDSRASDIADMRYDSSSRSQFPNLIANFSPETELFGALLIIATGPDRYDYCDTALFS